MWRFQLDPLSMAFVLLVTFVGGLIHVYSLGYMADDPDKRRFFAYLNLFVASMLLLVLASNYVMVYVGWEGVGLASYLLDRVLERQARVRHCRQEGIRDEPGRRHRDVAGDHADGDDLRDDCFHRRLRRR